MYTYLGIIFHLLKYLNSKELSFCKTANCLSLWASDTRDTRYGIVRKLLSTFFAAWLATHISCGDVDEGTSCPNEHFCHGSTWRGHIWIFDWTRVFPINIRNDLYFLQNIIWTEIGTAIIFGRTGFCLLLFFKSLSIQHYVHIWRALESLTKNASPKPCIL